MAKPETEQKKIKEQQRGKSKDQRIKDRKNLNVFKSSHGKFADVADLEKHRIRVSGQQQKKED